MFLDASIVVAILGREDDWKEQLAKLQASDTACCFNAVVRYEATIALCRLSQAARGSRVDAASLAEGEAIFDVFMNSVSAREVDISADIGRAALSAASAYGKVVGHPADLNFGDCFSYASAKALGVRLLYKGNDFALTDMA